MSMRTTAPQSGNKYYTTVAYGGYNKCILGYSKLRPWKGSVLSNCVGYAYGRFMEMANITKCDLPTCNAEDWYAKTTKYKKGQTPKVGAVIVWSKGKLNNSNDGCGHVAVVEKINSDGSLYLSESDYSTDVFKNRTVKKVNGAYYLGSSFKFLGFIYNPHIKEETTEKASATKVDTKSKYSTGVYEVTVDLLNVRAGAGMTFAVKRYTQLTIDAQKKIRELAGSPLNGYVKGLKCTVSEVKDDWGKTPSGWICLKYCKKV